MSELAKVTPDEGDELMKNLSLSTLEIEKDLRVETSKFPILAARSKIEEGLNQSLNVNNVQDEEHLIEPQYWVDFQPNLNVITTKQKRIVHRIKLKQENIIEKDKAIARTPSYYKFDKPTAHTLEMLTQKQISGEFRNVVWNGTNSVVIHFRCNYSCRIYFPDGNAIKVYKFSNSVEKNIAVYKRVQREYEHLNILHSQYVSHNTPYPVYKNKNVLVMGFIGLDQESAPSISSILLEKLPDMYHDIVKHLDFWYYKLGLIHGSLSARKIIYLGKLYFVGWSHSVRKNHPMALKKLMKDCQFVTKFFKSRGVSVKSAEELFKDITGIEKISSKLLEIVDNNLWNDPRVSNPNRIQNKERMTQNRFKC